MTTIKFVDGTTTVPSSFLETSQFYKGLEESCGEDVEVPPIDLTGGENPPSIKDFEDALNIFKDFSIKNHVEIYKEYGAERLVKIIKSVSFFNHQYFIGEIIVPIIASYINSDEESEEKKDMLDRMMKIASKIY